MSQYQILRKSVSFLSADSPRVYLLSFWDPPCPHLFLSLPVALATLFRPRGDAVPSSPPFPSLLRFFLFISLPGYGYFFLRVFFLNRWPVMIFGINSRGSPAAEGFCRREVRVVGGEGNKAMNDSRKRMELRRMKILTRPKSVEDQLISSGCDVGLKSKRLKTGNTVSKEVKLTDAVALVADQLTENGFVAGEINVGEVLSRTLTYESHGSISVIGRRREMEDAVTVELGFLARGGKNYDFFGVYDGHGGYRVAQACRDTLHKLVANIVGEDVGEEEINWVKVMAAGFGKMDEEVNKNGSAVATMGSTAVVAVVGQEEVVIANCGDSRAVLHRAGVAVQLSDDHKPDRPDELERIEVLGGRVINWNGQRVLGVLSTSRSIGDHYLKPYVITEPEVKIIKTTESDEFLILASDGLWDVISNDLACQITRKCLNGQIRRRVVEETEMGGGSRRAVEAAAVLAELAMARGSRDNISVIVVELKSSFLG